VLYDTVHSFYPSQRTLGYQTFCPQGKEARQGEFGLNPPGIADVSQPVCLQDLYMLVTLCAILRLVQCHFYLCIFL